MRHTALLATATVMLLGVAFGACSEKDDPEAMVIEKTAINPSSDGLAHHIGNAEWREAGTARLLGATHSMFSVSNTSKVRFSTGNLQYNLATGRFQFASRQYLTAETDTAAGTGIIDLFGWGTSGWEGGVVAYAPQSTEVYDSLYLLATDSVSGLYGDYADADWAYHNPIINGGNKARLWRVLRASEWQYLFSDTPKRYHKWGMATIEGTYKGVVVLPDEWVLPSELTFTPGAEGWNTNEYNAVQWFTMEQAGAVFLPASGYRDSTSVTSVGLTGNYWSADATSNCCAGDLFFRAMALDARDVDARHYGFSVRPVLD